MRCFLHKDIEAVGTCRACNKGICHECLVDLGHSIACRGNCEEKALVLNSQIARSEVVLRTQKRNRFFGPALFICMGVALTIFARDDDSLFNLGTVMGSGFVVFGIALAVLGHRYARDLDSDA